MKFNKNAELMKLWQASQHEDPQVLEQAQILYNQRKQKALSKHKRDLKAKAEEVAIKPKRKRKTKKES